MTFLITYRLCLFISKVRVHSHKTRSSSRGNYFVKLSRLDKQMKSCSRNSVKISEESYYIDLLVLTTKIS